MAAFSAAAAGSSEADVRKLSSIEVSLTFAYNAGEALGTLSPFVIDLDLACEEALVVGCYALRDGKVQELFANLVALDTTAEPEQIEASRRAFFRKLRERVPVLFGMTFTAVDPNNASNMRAIDGAEVRKLCRGGFISAQRGLDDVSQKESVFLGKVLEKLFDTAKSNANEATGHGTAEELEQVVADIQNKIGNEFNIKLDALLPALSLSGYPSLPDQKLRTETTLEVKQLLSNHNKVRYTGINGIDLPEAYNGLSTRNLILILLQLREFFKFYVTTEPRPGVHVVFIEEPEVHLHPQTQEVFIRKLGEIAAAFSKELRADWPVQFVVSTHSSHVANEAHFEWIRYFLLAPNATDETMRTVVKDLSYGLCGKGRARPHFPASLHDLDAVRPVFRG